MTFLLTFHNVLKTLNYLRRIKYFVQVGVHDGEMHDPLRAFILENDWRGILIEPQTDMLEKCRHNYQNKEDLDFINAAVHPTESVITLYKVENPKDYSHTGWASVNSDRFSYTIYENSFTEEQVQAVPLMEVIKDCGFKSVDLLQIDTEGFDAEVIKMFDFDSFHPALIQYEHCHLSTKEYENSINCLKGHDYICVPKKNDTFAIRKDLINPIFIASYLFTRVSRSLQSRLFN